MRILAVSFLFSTIVTWAQVPGGAPGPVKPLADSHVLATLDGEKMTVAQLRELLNGAPDLALRSAAADQRDFLVSHLLLRKMTAEALKTGISKKSPYADQLAWTRMQVLQGALFAEKTKEFRISEADADRYYRENPHLFGTAQVRLLFLAGNTAAVKARAAALLQKARAGADFSKLVELHSDEPEGKADGGKMSDVVPQSRLPNEVRKAIFATKPGGVVLVPYDGEHYLFKVEGIAMQPEVEAKDRATGDLVKVKSDAWIAEVRKTTEVKIEHAAFFKSLPATQGLEPSTYTGPKPDEIKESTVLAVINGKPMTAEDFTGLMKGISPQVRVNAVRAPEQFLEQYALLLRLAEMAEKGGLANMQPYKNQLRYNEEQILAQANVNNYLNNISILPDVQRKAYDDNPGRFRFAKLRVLYVPFSAAPPPQADPNAPKVLTEPEARAKVEGIMTELRAGKSFEDMVVLHSQDMDSRERKGEIPPIMADDQRIPEGIRKLVLAAQPGDIAPPMKLANGFWVFKIEGQGSRTYEEVKDTIYEELRQVEFDKWFSGVRSGFNVKIEDANAFRQVVDEAASLARRG